MFDAIRGVNIPICGAIEALSTGNHELVPLLWCSATPSAHVTEDAFEIINDQFLRLIAQASPLDAIYLDLHGAMVCEHLEDGEGEFLARVRSVVGDAIPIFVSLDLHANVTPLMSRHATLIDIYRTYPHIDMAETGYRVGKLLDEHLEQSREMVRHFVPIDFVIPLNSGCSLIEPCQSIYEAIPSLIQGQTVSLAFACGFPLSDIFHMGPSVVACGYHETDVVAAADSLANLINRNKPRFHDKIWSLEEGVQKAKAQSQTGGTVLLADTQDNPGGGGSGDTTGLLSALIDHKAENAIVATLSDPDIAAKAHQLGSGAKFCGLLGGKSGLAGQAPFPCTMTVLALSDGQVTGSGPMYGGARMSLGLTALVDVEGVQVLISSKPIQTADQEILKHIGVQPESKSIIALKSSVHYRNDFEKMAKAIFTVAAPGAVFCDPKLIDYENLRPELDLELKPEVSA